MQRTASLLPPTPRQRLQALQKTHCLPSLQGPGRATSVIQLHRVLARQLQAQDLALVQTGPRLMLGQTPFPIALPIHSQAGLTCPSLLTSLLSDITNLEDMIGETARSNGIHAPETLVSPESLATIETREKLESLAKLARVAITVRCASSVITDLLMLPALIGRGSTLIAGDRSTVENR